MKHFIAIFLLLIIAFNKGNAQSASIKGVITDTTNNNKISHAVIYILRASDSILLDCTRSGNDGSFQINNLEAGEIILLVSYPGYADYSDEMIIDSTTKIYLPGISMTNKIKLLEEIIVHGKVQAIKIKGDTTEYNAGSYNLSPNATAEDLLKKLPGIRITKDGQIIAQGEKVAQVLVDGEEFFSIDPKLVTQNLPANVISKVQVFDKKSEYSRATGVHDGNSTKTINIKLKENKKNGYFGKLGGGAGANGFYSQKAFFNAFKGKRKFAFFTNFSNIGKDDLNIGELKNFNNNTLINTNSNVGQLDTWNGDFAGEGLPELSTAGVHYDNSWGVNIQSVSADYTIQQLKISGEDSSVTAFNQPYLRNQYKEKKIFSNNGLRNSIHGKFESQVDSLTSFKISFSSQGISKKSNYDFVNENYSGENKKLNSEDRSLSVSSKVNYFNSQLSLVRHTRKPRRNIIFDISEIYKNENSNGFLLSHQSFFNAGILVDTQVTDQFKKNDYYFIGVVSKLTYTEPLSKTAFLLAGIELTETQSAAKIQSFNKSSDGKYDSIDTLFSNSLTYKSHLLKGELGYTLVKNKYYLISALGVGKTVYKQDDNTFGRTLSSQFVNLFPNLFFSYKLASKRRLTFRYDGLIHNPSIDQLQQTKVNVDPLNVFLGNPHLKPAFNNKCKISFFDFKASSEREINVRIIYNLVSNDIIYRTGIDSLGRYIHQYINIDGNRSLSENVSYSYKFAPYDLYISANATLTQSRYVNVINNIHNVIQNYSNELSLVFSKSIEKKFEISVEFAARMLENKFKQQSSNDIKYKTYSIAPSFDFYLPLKFRLHSDCNIAFYKKNYLLLKDYTILLWNAAIEKMFLKNNNLQFRVSANDLLNKNSGIAADYNPGYSSHSISKVVKRYVLLSLTWNFNKSKSPNQ